MGFVSIIDVISSSLMKREGGGGGGGSLIEVLVKMMVVIPSSWNAVEGGGPVGNGDSEVVAVAFSAMTCLGRTPFNCSLGLKRGENSELGSLWTANSTRPISPRDIRNRRANAIGRCMNGR